jgi:Pyridoxamine 5'-phosphate oxidase
MTTEERDEFLRGERTCRVATIGNDGDPHNSPLWFVWDGEALWLNSIVASQRWTDLSHDPRVSVVIDAGNEYFELRGCELLGRVEIIGEVPRTGLPDADLERPERLYGDKYGGGQFVNDGRHAWLRLMPEKIVSWDFRKIPAS